MLIRPRCWCNRAALADAVAARLAVVQCHGVVVAQHPSVDLVDGVSATQQCNWHSIQCGGVPVASGTADAAVDCVAVTD